MQKISPFLWFNNNAEEAVGFYTSLFKNSRIGRISHYEDEGERNSGRSSGSVKTIKFKLEGQEFVALNGGPNIQCTQSVSFMVNCRTQAEVEKFWKRLPAGGNEIQCGWLSDKYGLAWQIVPTILPKLLNNKDAERSRRVMQALLKMVKLDIKKSKQASATADKLVKNKSK